VTVYANRSTIAKSAVARSSTAREVFVPPLIDVCTVAAIRRNDFVPSRASAGSLNWFSAHARMTTPWRR